LRRQFWRSSSRAPQAQPLQRGIGNPANTGKHSRGGRNGATKRGGSCNVLGVKLATGCDLCAFNRGLRGAGSRYAACNRSCASGRRKGGNSACGARNIAHAKARLNGVFIAINA
jgi:hypothetical protein